MSGKISKLLRRWRAGLCAAALIAPASAFAADITHTMVGDGKGFIVVTGELVREDGPKFKTIAALYKSASVVLAGPGGSLSAGLAIGETVRERSFVTGVPAGAMCASACALAWLGGKPRNMSTTSRIGFHASFVVEDGKARETGVGNALVGAYMTRLGLPVAAVVHATQAAPNQMTWLNQQDATRLGIEAQVLDLNEGRPAPRTNVALGPGSGASGSSGPFEEADARPNTGSSGGGDATPETVGRGQYFVRGAEAVLKLAPFSGSPQLATLPPNERLVVLKRTGEWTRVRTGDGREGWTASQHIACCSN